MNDLSRLPGRVFEIVAPKLDRIAAAYTAGQDDGGGDGGDEPLGPETHMTEDTYADSVDPDVYNLSATPPSVDPKKLSSLCREYESVAAMMAALRGADPNTFVDALRILAGRA